MNKNFLIFISMIALFLLSYGCGKNNNKVKEKATIAKDSTNEKKIAVIGDTLTVSPNNKNLIILTKSNKISKLVMVSGGIGSKEFKKVNNGNAIKNCVWSHDGKLVAFEEYNTQGHSPLTTNHVWVVKSDGTGLTEVLLPKPNERFSTYDPAWKTDDSLIVTALTLDNPTPQKYVYDYTTGKTNKLTEVK